MKNLLIPFTSISEPGDGIKLVSSFLNLSERHSIDNLLWSNNGYKPKVSFAMAYTTDCIFLKYFVAEKDVTAICHKINDPVFKDTCVEFFIAFGDHENYYNLEFNRLGTPLIGYGSSRNDRSYIEKSAIAKIKSLHTIAAQPNDNGDTEWELTLSIPFSLFEHYNVNSLTGSICRVNFYKCGDGLAEPHFLSWSPIDHPHPNFHLPQFFGEILFV